MVNTFAFKCWFCGREYDDRDKADNCHDSGSYAIYRDGTKRKRNPFGN
jgi:rRNA maturation endonuclease Nob1